MSEPDNSVKHECYMQWTRFKKYLRMQLFVMYTWSCAMIFLVLADKSFMPQDGSEPTTWQHIQVFATSSFLWITIGGGGILMHWIWKHVYRFHLWYLQFCVASEDPSWIMRYEMWVWAVFPVLYSLFLYYATRGGTLPFWNQVAMYSSTPAFFAVLRFGLMCNGVPEVDSRHRNERLFWGYTSVAFLIPPIIGVIMIASS